ncbi:hypothetical protein [Roseibacillus ishigakijimensis]|uniref:Uncharacterized protein n=1 Tax=Roseibacillus ishigakijimensis TaxID=454146 RepID=A0A934RVS4_9BACT|nr:hypothetical protein [Roseibacillus ishigakijimensis]MBK1835356.1 hypothetical protein [Roseibacillus ishigakijimensis]
METKVRVGEGAETIFGSSWPDYGYDEWFLLTALYPRMVWGGVLTFVGWEDRGLNHWFALDIEYCTWANPQSEILHHTNPAARSLAHQETKILHRDEKNGGCC